jgi:hypothetical protein
MLPVRARRMIAFGNLVLISSFTPREIKPSENTSLLQVRNECPLRLID